MWKDSAWVIGLLDHYTIEVALTILHIKTNIEKIWLTIVVEYSERFSIIFYCLLDHLTIRVALTILYVKSNIGEMWLSIAVEYLERFGMFYWLARPLNYWGRV